MRKLIKRATNVKARQVGKDRVAVVFNVGGEYIGYGDKTKIIKSEEKTANLSCPYTYRGIKLAMQRAGFWCEAKHIVLPDRDRKKKRKARVRQEAEEDKVEDKPEAAS
jgi:hypothetical protein